MNFWVATMQAVECEVWLGMTWMLEMREMLSYSWLVEESNRALVKTSKKYAAPAEWAKNQRHAQTKTRYYQEGCPGFCRENVRKRLQQMRK